MHPDNCTGCPLCDDRMAAVMTMDTAARSRWLRAETAQQLRLLGLGQPETDDFYQLRRHEADDFREQLAGVRAWATAVRNDALERMR